MNLMERVYLCLKNGMTCVKKGWENAILLFNEEKTSTFVTPQTLFDSLISPIKSRAQSINENEGGLGELKRGRRRKISPLSFISKVK